MKESTVEQDIAYKALSGIILLSMFLYRSGIILISRFLYGASIIYTLINKKQRSEIR